MSKTILTNYTPAMDNIVDELGAMAAMVFGRIWRYCQGEYGECFASQETIAKDLKLSRATVNNYIGQLVRAGYLNETEKIGVTKTLRDTGKANFKQEVTEKPTPRPVENFDRSEDQKEEPVKKIDNPVKNFDTTCQKDLQVPVKNFDTKIDSIKELKKENKILLPDSQDNLPDPARVLKELKSTLKIEFDQTDFSRKIKPLEPLGWVGETLRIGHTNEPVIMFLNYRARKIFERNLRILTGNDLVEVEFVTIDERGLAA